MGQLFDVIRQLVAEERYIVGQHASERLEERGIMEWQVVAGMEDGELIAERARRDAQSGCRSARIIARRYGVQGRLVSSASDRCRQVGNCTFFKWRLSHAHSRTANPSERD